MENTNQNKATLASAFMNEGGQNGALQFLKDNKSPVTIFLITGIKLDGVIVGFDQYTISLLDVNKLTQLIYKDKISTICLKKLAHTSTKHR